VRGTQV
jgi:hypothetical protein